MRKHVLAGVAGVAIGVAIGYIIRKPDVDAVEEQVAEEVAEFKRRYKELHEAPSAPIEGEPEREEVKDVEESEELSKSYETTSDESDIEVLRTGTGIRRLSEDEFVDAPQCETETLLYYTIDGVVASVDEEELPDPDALIGSWYRELDADDSMFVRNEDVGVDYEIQAVPYSYKEYVLGE
nr:MAG TPA: YtxH-like protein [Caudoviricetes sp.]